MTSVKSVSSRKILDSNGNWTIETTAVLDDGVSASASVPTGVSVSPYEAKTVEAEEALKNVQLISKSLQGFDAFDQQTVDGKLLDLDGTPDKSKLGGNTLLSISLAICRAAAKSYDLPLFRYIHRTFRLPTSNFKLPKLLVLLLEGGKHGSGTLKTQEFMAIADTIEDGIGKYRKIRDELKNLGQLTSVGLEGGFTPSFDDKEALEFLKSAAFDIALDIAFESNEETPGDYNSLVSDFNVKYIEDPFGVEDWDKWVNLTQSVGGNCLVAADDLSATNTARIKKIVEAKAAGAIVIKPNQAGTLTETIEAVKTAQSGSLKIIVSHRGEETNDDFIADLAVAVGADYVKFGGLSRGERIAKYNRLSRICEELS